MFLLNLFVIVLDNQNHCGVCVRQFVITFFSQPSFKCIIGITLLMFNFLIDVNANHSIKSIEKKCFLELLLEHRNTTINVCN